MKRREFIVALGSSVTWPLAALAQQAQPVICFFNSGKSSAQKNNLAAFRQGLKEAGFTEGERVVIQFRWGENQFDRLPALASEVVASRPAIIVSNTLAAAATQPGLHKASAIAGIDIFHFVSGLVFNSD